MNNCFICVMDVILDELCENNINIDKTTLSYFINKTYYDYQNVYGSILGKLSYEDLFIVWEKTHPETFGHVMAFLTTVHFQNLSDEQRRNVVRVTVPILRNIDLTEYKREREYAWDKYTLVRNTVHRYVCVGMGSMLCQCYVIGNIVKLVVKRTLLWKVVSYWARAIKNAFTFK